MYGYKVVRKDGTKLLSATCANRTIVQYFVKRGVTVRPEGCGPLAVFSNSLAAAAFAGEYGCIVYKCSYEPSKEQILYDQIGNTSSPFILPAHTCFADSVKLIRRVA